MTALRKITVDCQSLLPQLGTPRERNTRWPTLSLEMAKCPTLDTMTQTPRRPTSGIKVTTTPTLELMIQTRNVISVGIMRIPISQIPAF